MMLVKGVIDLMYFGPVCCMVFVVGC